GHRPAERPGALHPRQPRAARRHQRHHRGGGAVRGGRDVLRGLAPAARQAGRGGHQGLQLDEPPGRGALVAPVATRRAAGRPPRRRRDKQDVEAIKGSIWMNRQEWARSWRPWIRGALLGFPLGSLPAGGAEIPTFLSYTIEKRLSKRPEEFGKGAIEGVAGPEA